MKQLLLFTFLLITCRNFAQCPFTVNLGSSGECPGAVLSVNSLNTITGIAWYKDGTVVNIPQGIIGYSTNGITVAGGHGGGPGADKIDHPQSIWVDHNGNIYVTDENNNRIQCRLC